MTTGVVTGRDLSFLTARPIAHRGLHDRAAGRPENTMAAFQAAADRGYAIECDVHSSVDGVPMVFHDDDLKRLAGAAGPIRDLSRDALRSLRIHETDEGIPTLADLLDLAAGKVPLVIEIKSVRGRNAGLAASVMRLIAPYRDGVAAMSFDPLVLLDARRVAPKAVLGLTSEGSARHAPGQLAALLGFRLDFISHSIADLPTPQTTFARTRLKKPLICWTVRTEAEREKARRHADQITFEGFLP